MNTLLLINQIYKTEFSREDIFLAATHLDSKFKETQMRNLMEKLQKSGYIIRIGRNQYAKQSIKGERQEYIGKYSDKANKVCQELEAAFPHLDYQVWELTWLNEFCNHLIAQNKIFVDTENDACEFVYTSIMENHKDSILLRPTSKELDYYSVENGLIIGRLVSETPQNKTDIHAVALERLIVDLFANKTLQAMISKGDYPEMIERIFDKYVVDQSKLFRYAKRRNKAKEISEFIKNNTSIKLVLKV